MRSLESAAVTIEEGFDFILSHFEEPIWPRTISTRRTRGGQILVNNKQESTGVV